RPRRAQGGRPSRQAGLGGRARGRRTPTRAARAGAEPPAPARRPGGRRKRPPGARLLRRAGARARAGLAPRRRRRRPVAQHAGTAARARAAMSVPLLWWDAPGPYEVAFSTRHGGVSTGPYEALNLGGLTRDGPGNAEENRRRLCEAVGADPEKLAMNRQVHSATVNRAVAGERGREGDGLWSDEPGVPMLKLTADCLPIALARRTGHPGLVLLHAGRMGLLEGVVEAGVA